MEKKINAFISDSEKEESIDDPAVPAKKIGRNLKGGNGKGQLEKRPAPWKGLPTADNLLRIANRLSIQVKKAEDPEAWKKKCFDRARALIQEWQQERGQGKSGGDLLLRATQMLREAGRFSPDRALALIVTGIMYMDKQQRKATEDADPVFNEKVTEFCTKANALTERQGLAEGDKLWDYHDPKTPEEYRHLVKELHRYSYITILKHIGEYDLTDLLLNDPVTFNRRFKAGMLEITKDDPDINLDDEFFEKVSL